LDGTLQEHGPCWLGLFAGHGAHGAGACRALCVEAEFRHHGQPGHHACSCPLNRQGTAAAAHPHACFSKGCSSTASCTPLQHLWGSKAHTYRLTNTYARTHTHTRMHAHTYTHTNTNAREYTQAHTRTYTCTRTNTRTHTRTSTHTNALTHRHTHAHTHTHMHMHAHVECVMGFANFSASLATLPHLSFSVRRKILGLILKFVKGTSPVCFVSLSAPKVLKTSLKFKLQFGEGSEKYLEFPFLGLIFN